MCNAYNNPCVLTVDPVEKLPLTHWLPGTQTLSLAVGGCNLRCLYCQNWRESQSQPHELRTYDVTAEDACNGARSREIRTIAYAYTEPVVFFDYARDVATFAREQGMTNVCATALFVNPPMLRQFCRVMDAFAVGLKGFDEQFYDRVLGSRLAPVLAALDVLAEERVHTEIVTLIIPTYNDDFAKIGEMCRWIVQHMGANTPLHFGRFVPEYRLRDLPRTPVPTLERCRQIGLEAGLKHVYIFNVSPHEGNHTYCGECGELQIERLGFRILRNEMRNGRCGHCHRPIPGVWTEPRH